MLSIVRTNDDNLLVMGDFNLDLNLVSSVIDLAISDHYCVFFCALLPSHSLVTEQVVRKRYLTSEVAENVINHINNVPPQILPSSCHDW